LLIKTEASITASVFILGLIDKFGSKGIVGGYFSFGK
jgi:hypothetical protein